MTAQPVMQALLNARIQEEPSVFGKWCIQRGVRPLPAAPAHVAAFVRDLGSLTSIETIWEAVSDVSLLHLSNGLADPTAGGPVSEVMNGISQIKHPRSWPKEIWPRFSALPYDLQRYLVDRDKEQEKVIRKALSETAKARQELAAIQQTAKAKDGNPKSHPTTA